MLGLVATRNSPGPRALLLRTEISYIRLLLESRRCFLTRNWCAYISRLVLLIACDQSRELERAC